MMYLIFGAGIFGKKLLDFLSYPRVEAFIDNDPSKIEFMGKPVIHFEELYEFDLENRIIVISSIKYREEMEKQLLEIGIKKYFCYDETMNCEYIPCYYMNKKYEAVSYNKILSMYNLNKYKKIAVLGGNDFLPYLISEIAIQGNYNNIYEVISEKKMQTVGVDIFDWQHAKKDFDCLIINVKRDHQGLREILTQIEENVDIIDIYDVDCTEQYFLHPELEKYKDIHKGKRVFLIGNGPSLKIEDLDKLHKENEICIAFNKIYRAFDKTEWRPYYYGMYDQNIVEDCLKDLDEIEGTIFVGDSYHYERPENKTEGIQYFHVKNSDRPYGNNTPKFSDDFVKGFYEGYSIVYTLGLQLAAYMGFSEIFLIGVDNNYSSDWTDNANYFIENYMTKEEKTKYIFKPDCIRTERAYQAAEEYSRKHGFRIFNATRGGKLEIFERVDFDLLW